MKVTCLFGSPRKKGNSSTLARKFVDTATEMGAEVRVFNLNTLDFKGCQGCDLCKTKQDHCAVDDGLAPVLRAVKETDVLVLSTPIYFMDVSSQMKAFIDRTYSFVEADYLTNPDASRLPRGKKLVFIQTQEADDDSYPEIFAKYDMFFKFYGFEKSVLIRVGQVGQQGGLGRRPEAFDRVESAAREFCS